MFYYSFISSKGTEVNKIFVAYAISNTEYTIP